MVAVRSVCWKSEGGDLDLMHPTPTPIYLHDTLRNPGIATPALLVSQQNTVFSKFISHMIAYPSLA